MSLPILATGEFCAPCKALKKNLEELDIQVEYKDSVKDVDFFIEQGIKSIPTLIIKSGEKITGPGQILAYLKENHIR